MQCIVMHSDEDGIVRGDSARSAPSVTNASHMNHVSAVRGTCGRLFIGAKTQYSIQHSFQATIKRAATVGAIAEKELHVVGGQFL
jgi:hypothetical protein